MNLDTRSNKTYLYPSLKRNKTIKQNKKHKKHKRLGTSLNKKYNNNNINSYRVKPFLPIMLHSTHHTLPHLHNLNSMSPSLYPIQNFNNENQIKNHLINEMRNPYQQNHSIVKPLNLKTQIVENYIEENGNVIKHDKTIIENNNGNKIVKKYIYPREHVKREIPTSLYSDDLLNGSPEYNILNSLGSDRIMKSPIITIKHLKVPLRNIKKKRTYKNKKY